MQEVPVVNDPNGPFLQHEIEFLIDIGFQHSLHVLQSTSSRRSQTSRHFGDKAAAPTTLDSSRASTQSLKPELSQSDKVSKGVEVFLYTTPRLPVAGTPAPTLWWDTKKRV
ncbi:hypothetical protein EVAR_47384_1 [Eumeta japonica]|uniref:Uncharacterized protein n=1 Tax=Eumeta variegata TaxID=151549 RepID=A0A4C1WV62_EUMVA|nr:hypothetical protein EVAR_47384_1 [Eumeta japonica]